MVSDFLHISIHWKVSRAYPVKWCSTESWWWFVLPSNFGCSCSSRWRTKGENLRHRSNAVWRIDFSEKYALRWSSENCNKVSFKWLVPSVSLRISWEWRHLFLDGEFRSHFTFDNGQGSIRLVQIECYFQCFMILFVHQQIRHFLFPTDEKAHVLFWWSKTTYISSTSSTFSRLVWRSSLVES